MSSITSFQQSNLWPNSRTDSFWRSVNRKRTRSESSGGSEVQTVYYASRPYPTYLELPPRSTSTYSWCFICGRWSIWKNCSLNKVKRVRMTARAGFACFEQLGWRCPWRTAQRQGQGAWVTSLETSNNNNKNKKRIVWSENKISKAVKRERERKEEWERNKLTLNVCFNNRWNISRDVSLEMHCDKMRQKLLYPPQKGWETHRQLQHTPHCTDIYTSNHLTTLYQVSTHSRHQKQEGQTTSEISSPATCTLARV